MRKYLVFLYVALLVPGFVATSNASLTTVGAGAYVYDDAAEIWWWADLKTFTPEGDIGLNTYDAQISYINEELGDDWHMASLSEIEGLADNSGQDIVDSFIPTSSTPSGINWYYGRYDLVFNEDRHYGASISDINGTVTPFMIDWREKDDKGGRIGAWVCTATNPVPIPAAVWLLGSGLIGLAGLRRKIKN